MIYSVNKQLRDEYIVHGVTLARVQTHMAKLVDDELVKLTAEIVELFEKQDPQRDTLNIATKQFRLNAFIVKSRRLIADRIKAISDRVMRELEILGVAETEFSKRALERVLNSAF